MQNEIAAKKLTCSSSFGFVTDADSVKESLMHFQLPLGKDWDVGQPLFTGDQAHLLSYVGIRDINGVASFCKVNFNVL